MGFGNITRWDRIGGMSFSFSYMLQLDCCTLSSMSWRVDSLPLTCFPTMPCVSPISNPHHHYRLSVGSPVNSLVCTYIHIFYNSHDALNHSAIYYFSQFFLSCCRMLRRSPLSSFQAGRQCMWSTPLWWCGC